jgi:catechol 2,3-dioxygenase
MSGHSPHIRPRAYGVAPPGFVLPDASHVGAVRLQISDLERSLDFYQRVLGLRIVGRDGAVVALGPHGDDRPLVHLHERRGAQPVPKRGAFGLYHFAILLPERESLGRFLMHLAEVDAGRLGMADHIVSEALYLWDPDGLGIEVYADRPREMWQYPDREVIMATDPLDTESLVAAAGATRWAGMPFGTRMGHMHLHVGDLARADAFYHRGLGLEKMVWSYPSALFLAAGGYHHHLGLNTWSPGPSARDDQARLMEWELVVPDWAAAEAAARSLRTNGYESDESTEHVSVSDPWGTRLRVVAGE